MSSSSVSLADASTVANLFSDKEKARGTIKLKKPNPKIKAPGNWKESELVGAELQPNKPSSLLVNPLSPTSASAFPTARPLEDEPEKLQCRHCKRTILKSAAPNHIRECLRKKQEKIQKKKEAKEARDAARKGNDKDADAAANEIPNGADEGEENGVGKKSAVSGAADGAAAKKGKKRKADDEGDKVTKKQKKKDEPKAKAPKPKGPVDVEKQCGVLLPNGNMCARSLTCKSHSMGAKRAVPGRSAPYDILLAQYQKKNQAKQQRAALDANAPPSDDDSETNQVVDWDEEADLIMSAISRARPQPLLTRPLMSTRSKYQYVRMKEMLHNALGGSRGSTLFATKQPQLLAPPPPPVFMDLGEGGGGGAGGGGGGGGGGVGRAGVLGGGEVNMFMSSLEGAGNGERRMSGVQRGHSVSSSNGWATGTAVQAV